MSGWIRGRLEYGLAAFLVRSVGHILRRLESREDRRVARWRANTYHGVKAGRRVRLHNGFSLNEVGISEFGNFDEARVRASIARLEGRDLPLDPDGYDPFGDYRGPGCVFGP